jgi:hypothetical protein
VGGAGGAAGNGGAVTVIQSGGIRTDGNTGGDGTASDGIFAQSVGGGGGKGGFAAFGSARDAYDDVGAAFLKGAAENKGIARITGALKEGKTSVQDKVTKTEISIAVGGVGGAAGNGGAVSVTNTGTIVVNGNVSSGIFAQSVGGGGGVGGATATINPASLTIGGVGRAGGDGGSVTVVHTGDIVLNGIGNYGIYAQSVGGGGGKAGATGLGVADWPDGKGLSLSIPTNIAAPTGVESGAGGDGGDVTVRSSGKIILNGIGGVAFFAQSVGGGGGIVGDAMGLGHYGSIFGPGKAGKVSVEHSGDLLSLGLNGVAFLAQSSARDGEGDINVNLDGNLRGGDILGVGLLVDGGQTNQISSSGAVSAVSGRAILTTSGDDHVENLGFVFGDVDLGGGQNSFHNHQGATFVALSNILLRSSDTSGSAAPLAAPHEALLEAGTQAAATTAVFNNDGDYRMGLAASRVPIDLRGGAQFSNLDQQGDPTLNPLYGARVINTVALDGNFVQTVSGRMAFDVAFGPYGSDHVDATGRVILAGEADITLTWLENGQPVRLFSAAQGGTDAGLSVPGTIALDYIVQAGSAGVDLAVAPHFGAGFLNRNGRALGAHFDSAVMVGDSGGLGRVAALLGNLQPGQEAAYSSIFRQLDAEPHLAPLRVQMANVQNFNDALFGCAGSQQRCAWADLEVENGHRDGSPDSFALKTGVTSLRGGFQVPLAGTWSLAGALGYDAVDSLSVDNGRTHGKGENVSGGLGLEAVFGAGTRFTAALSAGTQSLTLQRRIDVFGPLTGLSKPRSDYLDLSLRASRRLAYGGWFLEPSLEVSETALRRLAFSETGLEGLGYVGKTHTQYIAAATPELALGGRVAAHDHAQVDLSVSFGARIGSNDELDAPLRLVGANPGSAAAKISTPSDAVAYRLGAKLEVLSGENTTVSFTYRGEFGRMGDRQRAGVEASLRF